MISSLVIDIIAGSVAALAVAGLVVVAIFGRKKQTMPKVFAAGSLLVTETTGEVVIDEVLPSNKALLENPDQYVIVQFDPTELPPPPCAGGLPDEVDWTLFYKHIHDTHLEKGEKTDELRLKIEWRISASRTIIWKILQP